MTLLVGTTKGVFLISEVNDRSSWAVQGPYCDGWPINHVIGDPETEPFGRGAVANGTAQGSGAARTAARIGGHRLTKGKMDDRAANDPNFATMIGWTDQPCPLPTHSPKLVAQLRARDAVCRHKPASLLASENGGKDWKR